MNNLKSVLLNKSEINYILNSNILSKSFEYKIKSQLKKKISIFLTNEFPLLFKSGLIDINDILISIYNNNMSPILGKEKVAGSNPAQGFLFEHKFHCLMRKNECLRYLFCNIVTKFGNG
jgi:hypothetical protein